MEPWPDNLDGQKRLPYPFLNRPAFGFPKAGSLEQAFEQKIQNFDQNWEKDFGSSFAMGNPSVCGTQKAGSTNLPPFGYSQKNFHIADGNLYSIFSPFQARKSNNRPSFLRGQKLTDESLLGRPLGEASVFEDTTMPSLSDIPKPKSRLKLKFHQQDVPLQYRSEPKSEGSSKSSTSKTSSSTTHHRSSSSSSSSFSKSHSLFTETSNSFFGQQDDLKIDDIFQNRKRTMSDSFEVLDLSNTHEDMFEKDWERMNESGHRLSRSQLRRSFFEDSDDDDDDDEPLNLCIADHRKNKTKGESSSSHFGSTGEKIKHMQKSLFANRSPGPLIFRSPSLEFSQGPSDRIRRECEFQHDIEEEAMDLSFKEESKSERKRFCEKTSSSTSSSSSKASSRKDISAETLQKSRRRRKVPYISEMLENMTIWDDHSQSSHPKAEEKGIKTESTAEGHPEVTVNVFDWTTEQSSEKNVQEAESAKRSSKIETVTVEEGESSVRKTEERPYPPEAVPHGYYVFVPNSYVPTYSDQIFVPHLHQQQQQQQKQQVIVNSESSVPAETSKGQHHHTERLKSKPLKPIKSSSSATRHKRFSDSGSLLHQSKDHTDNDVNICKFKLIKGVQPMLEEKKNFFVSLPRSKKASDDKEGPSSSKSNIGPKSDSFRTYKIHVGLQEDIGKKLAAGRKNRRRSRKALARDKLEATFREQGFLIKTQQVSSAEGSVYCKFRQLKKFTRYLFKSWRNYLPKELEEADALQTAMPQNFQHLSPAITLSLPDIPAVYEQTYMPSTSRSASMSAAMGLGSCGTGNSEQVMLTVDNVNVLSVPTPSSESLMTDGSSTLDSYFTDVSPCPSNSSLTHASSTSSVP